MPLIDETSLAQFGQDQPIAATQATRDFIANRDDLGVADIFADILDQWNTRQLASDSQASYLQSLQASLAQDAFAFEKTKWSDQLSQWNQQFGFSEEQFDATFGLSQKQLAQSGAQFQEDLAVRKEAGDRAWTQFLTNMEFNKDQFEFTKTSFTDQLDFSKFQFEEQMGFNFAQLESQMGISRDQLSLERAKLAQSASNFAAQIGLESKSLDLQRELGLGQLSVQKGQLALNQQAQAFQEKTISTQMLLEAAGLAASPTGAIQLAYMARASGAPAGSIASIFSNLPFVQAALKGETLPGFGVPEQLGGGTQPSGATFAATGGASSAPTGGANLINAALGGGGPSPSGGSSADGGAGPEDPAIAQERESLESRIRSMQRKIAKFPGIRDQRVLAKAQQDLAALDAAPTPTQQPATSGTGATSSAGTGDFGIGGLPSTLGIKLPGLTDLTEQQFSGMTDQEKLFLGALFQSETGEPIEQVLSKIQKSFIPTANVSALGI